MQLSPKFQASSPRRRPCTSPLPALRAQRPGQATRWRRRASQRPGHFAPTRWAARRRRDASAGPRAESRPQAGGGGDTDVSHPRAPDRSWGTVPRGPARMACERPSRGHRETGGSPCARGSTTKEPVAWGSGGLTQPRSPLLHHAVTRGPCFPYWQTLRAQYVHISAHPGRKRWKWRPSLQGAPRWQCAAQA